MKSLAILAVVLVGIIATILRGAETQPATAASQAGLLAIRYERTGGFVGTDDVIEITPAGAVVVQGKLMGNGKGQLTAEQMSRLAGLFAEWKTLKGSYPAPAGSADGFEVKIRYGTVEVSASELNGAVPGVFKAVRGALEQVAQDIKK